MIDALAGADAEQAGPPGGDAPDSNALGEGEQPRWLYTVRFDATELWGAGAPAGAVYVDCWEPHLETPAGSR